MLSMKTITAAPLFSRLKGRGARAAFAKQLGMSEGRLSNWQTRGIPPAMIPVVSAALQMTIDEYYQLATGAPDKRVKTQFEADNDVQKIFVLLRTLLDTDPETRGEIFLAVEALAGDRHGAARTTVRHKPKR